MSHCLKKSNIKSCHGEDIHVSDDKSQTKVQDDSPFIPICPYSIPHRNQPQIDLKLKELSPTKPTPVCMSCEGNYTDLYCLGKIWVNVVKTALFGVDLKTAMENFVPVVEAKESKEKKPDKPGAMKYKDLPLYAAPHFEYKDFVEKSKKCRDYDVKILHEALVPTVREYRRTIQKAYEDIVCGLCCTYRDVRKDALCSIRGIKDYFRDPKRSDMRQGIVITSSILGYLLARKKIISKRIIYTGIGAFGSGFLCFPDETDVALRTLLYHVGRTTVYFYNLLCKRQWNIRGRVPCERDLPECKPVVGLKKKEES